MCKLCERVVQSGFQIDTSGSEWQNLVKARKIRDRITHPGPQKGLEIDQNDQVILWRAMGLFKRICIDLIDKNLIFEALALRWTDRRYK